MTKFNFKISLLGPNQCSRLSDPNFSDQIHRLKANDNNEDDNDFSTVDDLDADPNFIISDEEGKVQQCCS